MDALVSVVAFAVAEQVGSGFVPGRPSSLVSAFDLQGVEKLSRGALSQQQPARLMEGVAVRPARCFR